MNEVKTYEVVFKMLKYCNLPDNELSILVYARNPVDASAAAVLHLFRDPERAKLVDSIITVDRVVLLDCS